MQWAMAGVILSTRTLAIILLAAMPTIIGRVSIASVDWFLEKQWSRPSLKPSGGSSPEDSDERIS